MLILRITQDRRLMYEFDTISRQMRRLLALPLSQPVPIFKAAASLIPRAQPIFANSEAVSKKISAWKLDTCILM